MAKRGVTITELTKKGIRFKWCSELEEGEGAGHRNIFIYHKVICKFARIHVLTHWDQLVCSFVVWWSICLLCILGMLLKFPVLFLEWRDTLRSLFISQFPSAKCWSSSHLSGLRLVSDRCPLNLTFSGPPVCPTYSNLCLVHSPA